jgi:RNA recognition motif-containing protein
MKMSVRLFVGNLAWDVTEPELKELFSEVGQVSFVSIPKDRETNKPRGFAFVELADKAQADEAIRRFNNQLFKGRPLAINEAREREGGGGRPSQSARPSSYSSQSARPSYPSPGRRESSEGPSAGAPPIMDKPNRNFGPDAAPRRAHKKTPRGGGKQKGAPKQPMREKAGGRFFGVEDDSFDESFDDGLDMQEENLATHASEDSDEENP